MVVECVWLSIELIGTIVLCHHTPVVVGLTVVAACRSFVERCRTQEVVVGITQLPHLQRPVGIGATVSKCCGCCRGVGVV